MQDATLICSVCWILNHVPASRIPRRRAGTRHYIPAPRAYDLVRNLSVGSPNPRPQSGAVATMYRVHGHLLQKRASEVGRGCGDLAKIGRRKKLLSQFPKIDKMRMSRCEWGSRQNYLIRRKGWSHPVGPPRCQVGCRGRGPIPPRQITVSGIGCFCPSSNFWSCLTTDGNVPWASDPPSGTVSLVTSQARGQ